VAPCHRPIGRALLQLSSPGTPERSARFPLRPDNQRASDAAAQRRTILFVEDDPASGYAITRVLERAGYLVVHAPDYRDALARLDAPEPIDLLLTDIRLPAGTPHGFALGRMARMRRREIRVLYLTGVVDLPENELANALGRVLRKPIEPEALLREIDQALADG
jgi:CheY-like chemotaxis protein